MEKAEDYRATAVFFEAGRDPPGQIRLSTA